MTTQEFLVLLGEQAALLDEVKLGGVTYPTDRDERSFIVELANGKRFKVTVDMMYPK